MSSIINELQRLAMESGDISELLRKAYLVARKLKVTNIEEWLNNEMNGYNEETEVPKYREITGTVQWLNSVRGWCPTIFSDPEYGKFYSSTPVKQSISELQTFTEKDSLTLMTGALQHLESTEHGKFRLVVTKSEFEKILNAVRNIVLDWALKLEEEGITGEGISFSDKDRERASNIQYHVSIQGVQGSQIQLNTSHSSQQMSVDIDKEELQRLAKEIEDNYTKIDDLEQNQKARIEQLLQQIKQELQSDTPSPTIISKCLNGIKSLALNVGGNIISSGIIYQISQFLDK